MPEQWHNELKQIQRTFEQHCGGPPVLKHALLVDGAGLQNWWEQASLKPTVSTTWATSFLRPGHEKSERWDGCFWFSKQDGSALSYEKHMVTLLERFNRLADGIKDILAEQNRRIDCVRPSITAYPGRPYNSGDAFADWLFYIHDVAWNQQHDGFSADRYRLCRKGSKVQRRKYDRVSAIVDGPEAMVFPHEFFCVLKPDVLTASVHAIDVLITEVRQAKKLPPRWSVTMTLKEIAEALQVNDTRTVKSQYEHALHQLSRQAYRIDINAVAPPRQDNFTQA